MARAWGNRRACRGADRAAAGARALPPRIGTEYRWGDAPIAAAWRRNRAWERAMDSGNLGAYNIEDLRRMARKRLPRGIFEYVDGAAEDGIALRHNREVYQSLKIKNRVLKDISKRSTA